MVLWNENSDLVPTRTVTGWRVCIGYIKLNKAIRNDHFPLPFIVQMFDRWAGNDFFSFLDGYLGHHQITIVLEDQQKMTFACPYGTSTFWLVPFGLCNAPTNSNSVWRLTAIFIDMMKHGLEVLMDDFTVFGETFDDFLHILTDLLQHCQNTNLILN